MVSPISFPSKSHLENSFGESSGYLKLVSKVYKGTENNKTSIDCPPVGENENNEGLFLTMIALAKIDNIR